MKVTIDNKEYIINKSDKETMGIVNTLSLGQAILHKDEGRNFALINHIVHCVQAMQTAKEIELKKKLKMKKQC